eukprot:Pgem_evm1s976
MLKSASFKNIYSLTAIDKDTYDNKNKNNNNTVNYNNIIEYSDYDDHNDNDDSFVIRSRNRSPNILVKPSFLQNKNNKNMKTAGLCNNSSIDIDIENFFDFDLHNINEKGYNNNNDNINNNNNRNNDRNDNDNDTSEEEDDNDDSNTDNGISSVDFEHIDTGMHNVDVNNDKNNENDLDFDVDFDISWETLYENKDGNYIKNNNNQTTQTECISALKRVQTDINVMHAITGPLELKSETKRPHSMDDKDQTTTRSNTTQIYTSSSSPNISLGSITNYLLMAELPYF